MFTNPSVSDFKTYFFRDFPYGTDPNTTVLDQDIGNALADADINFNQALFATQQTFTTGFLLLSAHFLVLNLRAASQGVQGQYNFIEQSKSVGSVASSFGIPDRILENPELAMLCKTNYGAKFLFLILPQLTGQMFISHGGTRA